MDSWCINRNRIRQNKNQVNKKQPPTVKKNINTTMQALPHQIMRRFTTSCASSSTTTTTILPPSIQALHDRCRQLPTKRTIVLTEGADVRVQQAAVKAVEQDLCNVLVLDDTGTALCNVPPHIQVLNPRDHPNFVQLTEDYCFQRGLKKNKHLQHAKESPTYETDLKDAVSPCLFFFVCPCQQQTIHSCFIFHVLYFDGNHSPPVCILVIYW